MGADQQLFEQLSRLRGSRTIIVGIGNTLKADDGAGPLVCEKLKEAKISAGIIDTGTVPENYIQRIIKSKPENIIVIDAMDFGAQPGAIDIFMPEQLNSTVTSTHTLSPRLFIEMIMESIKTDVYFIGIQPAQTQLGQAVSGQVSDAVRKVGGVLADIFPNVCRQQLF